MLKSFSNRLGGQLSPLSKFNTSPEIETVETPRRSTAVTKSEPSHVISDRISLSDSVFLLLVKVLKVRMPTAIYPSAGRAKLPNRTD